MIRRPPKSTPLYSSAASDVYKRQEGYCCGAARANRRTLGERTEGREGLWKCRVHGKHGKAKAAFPLFPRPLGNLAKGARFPHSHSLALPRMGKWKTKIRFPTFPRGACDDDLGLSIFRTKNQERRSAASRPPQSRFSGSRSIGNRTQFQDHPSIGKCWGQRGSALT